MRKLKEKILSFILLFVFFVPMFSANVVSADDFAVTKDLRITFVGDCKSGKTALISRLSKRCFDFDAYHQTQNSSILAHAIDYDEKTKLCCLFHDNSGQDSVKEEVLKNIVPNSHIVVIVVDLAGKFEEPYKDVVDMAIKKWYLPIKGKYSPLSKIIMVGTKLDKISSPKEKDEITKKIKKYASNPKHSFNFVLTSAKTGRGLVKFYKCIRGKVDVKDLDELKFSSFLGAGDVNRKKCEKCEQWFDKRISRDDFEYCPTCCERYLTTCAKKDCNKKVRSEDGVTVYCYNCFAKLPFCPGCVGEKCNEKIDPERGETHCPLHKTLETCCSTGCGNKIGSKFCYLTDNSNYDYGTESTPDAPQKGGKYCSLDCLIEGTDCCKRGNCTHKICKDEKYCDYHGNWLKRMFRWGL